MSTPSVTPAPSLGLGDDLSVYAHSYIGNSIVTDFEPLVSVTLYGTASGGLVDLGHIAATPVAAERLRDALSAALDALAADVSPAPPAALPE